MSKEIIGRKDLVNHIRTAVAEDKVSHAYILEGEKGMGKLFLAKYFAKTLLCTEKKMVTEGERRMAKPCKSCVSCRQAGSGNHPDIIYVEHEKTSVITVSEIREQVVSTVDIFPYSSKYKVYIIKDAEKMNEQAQNALLKTIEEPPEYVVIFLLSANKGRLLSTILSRCVLLDVKPVPKEEIISHLMEHYEVPDYAAEYAADFSAGNIGRAIRYATEDNFIEMKNEVVSLLKKLDHESVYDIIHGIKTLALYKNEIKDCVDFAMLWFRDMLVLKATADTNRLLFKEEFLALREQANVRSYEAIEKALLAMDKTKQRLEANANFETSMELMFLHMKDK